MLEPNDIVVLGDRIVAALGGGESGVDIGWAPIDASGSGTHTIVGSGEYSISVVSYALSASGATSIQWGSDETPISGEMHLIESAGFAPVSSNIETPLLVTGYAEDLTLTLSADTYVGGHIVFQRVGADE